MKLKFVTLNFEFSCVVVYTHTHTHTHSIFKLKKVEENDSCTV